jgi:hypothetical protein
VTQRNPNEWQQKQLEFTCDYCGAQPGDWCVTTGGQPVTWLHGSRHYQARDKYVTYPEV